MNCTRKQFLLPQLHHLHNPCRYSMDLEVDRHHQDKPLHLGAFGTAHFAFRPQRHWIHCFSHWSKNMGDQGASLQHLGHRRRWSADPAQRHSDILEDIYAASERSNSNLSHRPRFLAQCVVYIIIRVCRQWEHVWHMSDHHLTAKIGVGVSTCRSLCTAKQLERASQLVRCCSINANSNVLSCIKVTAQITFFPHSQHHWCVSHSAAPQL